MYLVGPKEDINYKIREKEDQGININNRTLSYH